MIIKTFPLGLIGTNAYLLIDEETKEAIVIDLGGDFGVIQKELEKYGANLKYILNTHGHFDHIIEEKDIQDRTGVPVYIHEDDKFLLQNLTVQTAALGIPDVLPPKDVITFNENSILKLGNKTIKIIHTPGHTQGSCCFLIEDNLFSGDTLFYGSVGRTDLAGGNFKQLQHSIVNILFQLNDNINVYPGHDAKTTIGYEKKYNSPFGSQR